MNLDAVRIKVVSVAFYLFLTGVYRPLVVVAVVLHFNHMTMIDNTFNNLILILSFMCLPINE